MKLSERGALDLMAILVSNTNGWDELSIEQWKRQLMALGDGESAARGVKLLVRHWTSGSRPTWGKFMESYSPKPDLPRFSELPSRNRAISALQYLTALRERAQNDPHAEAEMADWERAVKSSNVWARSIPGLADAVHQLREDHIA